MKVKVVSKKLIKPCTPTPQTLRDYKISLTDELAPPININLILFYPASVYNTKPDLTNRLQQSLAQTLPHFYPLAGRYIYERRSVECNDEGVEFVEAEVDGHLMAKMGKDGHLNGLISLRSHEVDRATNPLLSLQVTRFECGGISIGIIVSHRIFDACSLETFVTVWACITNEGRAFANINSSFESPSLFPYKMLGRDFGATQRRIWDSIDVVIKHLVFNKEDITTLRSKLMLCRNNSNEKLVYLSRVRLVSTLITAAMINMDRAKHGKSRVCFVSQVVNMRGRLSPPLPKHACGNLALPTVTQIMSANENKEIEAWEIVRMLGDDIERTIKEIGRMSLSLGEDGHNKILDAMEKIRKVSTSGEVNSLVFTDWSKFGIYRVDFGWGRPVWAGVGTMFGPNVTVLLENSEGGGIEAWVHLDPSDLPYFEQAFDG